MLKRFLHQTPCVFRRLLYGLFLQFFAFTFSFASVQETKSVRDYPLNIEFNKNTLVETFQIIESATDYHFAYDRGKLDPNVKFSGKYKIPRTVGDVLLDIAKETGLSFKQINKNITVINANKDKESSPSLEVIIEDVIITGKVTSEEGEALPGVNIIVKGTNIGTVTDIDGHYSLKSPEGSTTLIFSFIGYASQEVPVNGRSVINIMLTSDIAQLSEIVVVGYGEMERKDVTGSISSVGSDEIKDLGATRVDQALLGKAAGVQVMPVSGEPGAPPQIRIRGVGSISAAGDPLYVVDGFPMQSIQTINPNDIESIDVLKDASATAIYGSRGSNGVIIINTKRGKEGKPTFKYDAYFGFQKIAKMPEFQSAKEEAQHYFDGIRNRNIDEGNDVSGPVETWKIAVPVTVVEVLEGRTPTQPGVTLDFKDPFDEILVTAPQQQHQLSANGGGENVKYAISGEYLSQDGIILNSNFKRYSMRSNIDSKLTDKLSIKTSINPSYVDKTNVGGTSFDGVNSNTDILYNSLVIPQYYSLYNPDGSYFPFGGGLDAVVTTQNPVALANEVINRQRGIGLLGNINVEYAILDELKVNVAAGTNLQAIKGMSFKPQLPAFFNNPAVGSDYSALRLNWLTETTLNYNKSFGDHNFSGLAGFTTQKETVESNSLTSNRYPNNLVPTLSAVSGIITGGTSNYYEWSLVSYLGRVNYNYLGKYYFTASLRTDGSSRFGSENKFGVFPSLALAWRISDESFMQSMPALSEMKLRTSYGSTGNNNIGNYEHYATINYDKYTLGGGAVGGYAPGRLANPSLTWETQKQINVGVDLSFVDNRLGFNIDYFNSRNYDLLLNVNVPDVTGFSTALKNIGEVKNSGWEFVASTVNTTGDFKWTTNFNISTYKNEVVKLGPEGDPIISGGNITMIGQPIGMFYGWLSDGVFKNQAELDAGPIFNPGARDASRVGDVRFVDVSGPEGVPDGVINSLDKTIMGSPYPDFYYGMTNNLSYKNISLTIGIQGSKGNEILAISRNQLANNRSRFRQLSIMNDYWQSESEPGDGSPRPNDTPTGNFRGQFSQLWLDTGTYLRINNITLGYLLPDAFVERLNLSSLRVYINTINPFLFTKHIGFNPDVSRSGSALNPGNEQYDYPVAKSIKLGLNVGF